jgi:hypothetical protein
MKKRSFLELILTICILVTATVQAQTLAFVNWKCAPPDSQESLRHSWQISWTTPDRRARALSSGVYKEGPDPINAGGLYEKRICDLLGSREPSG